MDILERLRRELDDRYRIQRELGRGGMGLVFVAEDLKHGRRVVLKVLRPELAQSLGAERFLREIRISARLTHPHILTLIDSGRAGDLMYYVLPYVEGESLRDRLERERELPIDDALAIAAEVADALAYAHDHGVVHRDIKPENILLEAGHAVVADFGIATAVSEAGGERLTETGMVVGTPAYLSPEQAAAVEPVDPRSDIYSLGCVVYEMLAGTPPYVGPTAQAILARKALEPVPGLRVVRDTVPPGVEAAVTRALARVPADRFATAGEFATALTRGDGGLPTPPADSGDRTSRRRRRRLALASGLAAALAVAAGAYALLARSGPDATRGVAVAGHRRLTADPGVELFPSLSPDGDWIVYAAAGAGDRDIYLRSVSGENAIDLTPDSPADDDQPAFSPDGERIAFRSERDGGGLFVMGRTGEAVRRLTRDGYNPTWSPDGALIAYTGARLELNPQNTEGVRGLWVVSVRSGEARQLSAGDAALPSWSPGGLRIAFTRRLGDPARADVWTIPADGGDPTPVTNDVATDWNPAWSPDGAYLYFASDRGGSMNLWRVPIDERSGNPLGEPEAVTTPATSLAHISVARDGRHVAYASVLSTANIQAAALDAGAGRVTGPLAWVTTGSRRWSSPDITRDGEWVVFYSLTEPEGDIHVARPDGTALRRVTGDTTIDRTPRWSPDGEWIAFFSNRGGTLDVWRIRRDGSDLSRVTELEAGVPVWAPDGSRLAVGALDGGTYIVDPARPWGAQTPGRLPAPESAVAGFRPNDWSPDGRWLTGDLSYADDGIVVYSFATRSYERLTDFGQWPVWLPDNRGILFVSGGNAFYTVDRVTRDVRKVFSVGRDVLGPPRVTADGARLFYSRRVTEADLWLLTLE